MPTAATHELFNNSSQSINYEYNNNYHIAQETHSDGAIITYEYTKTSVLLTFIRNDGSIKATQFSYNQAEKRFFINNHNGLILSHAFDELGKKRN
jgi:YD repeat-containing protein